MTTIAEQLSHIQSAITRFETRYERDPGSVQLLAVSKSHPSEEIRAAYTAGQTRFGESYLQEALEKMSDLTDLPIEWHFIGPIQSNKTKKIAEHFAWVHSIDSQRIAKRLNDQRPTQLPPLNVCIEVNVSQEVSKSGVNIDEVQALATFCRSLPHLRLRGLMTIPAMQEKMDDQRRAFHTVQEIYKSLRTSGFELDTLSMGMSADFEAAIAEGSTMVRIGTSIFGQRIVL